MKKNLVILHGWGATSASFNEVKTLLEKEGFSVEVPDLPGFGNVALKNVMTFDDYVSFVEKFIGEQKVIAIGHSFGGRILIALAGKKPTLLEKLILVDASGITHPRSWKKNLGYFLAKSGKRIFSLPVFSSLFPLTRKLLYVFLDEWDYYKSEGLLLETFKSVYTRDVREYLPQIRVPTLIVWGEKDKTTPLEDGFFMEKHIQNAKIVVITGGTHEVLYKMPHVFIENILPFLRK